MSEFKGTKGKWFVCKTSGGIKCESVKGLLASAWSVYDADNVEKREKGESWLDMRKRTDPIRELKKTETSANAQLISKAPEMLEMLKEAKRVICSMKLSMWVHPDCSEDSEFYDMATTGEETEDKIEKLIKEATAI